VNHSHVFRALFCFMVFPAYMGETSMPALRLSNVHAFLLVPHVLLLGLILLALRHLQQRQGVS
jgi:hypothetical protein